MRTFAGCLNFTRLVSQPVMYGGVATVKQQCVYSVACLCRIISIIGLRVLNSSAVNPMLQLIFSGISVACCCSCFPAAVSCMFTIRSSSLLRMRLISFFASSLFNNGVNVPESSMSNRPSAFTDKISCSHNASITRYCG